MDPSHTNRLVLKAVHSQLLIEDFNNLVSQLDSSNLRVHPSHSRRLHVHPSQSSRLHVHSSSSSRLHVTQPPVSAVRIHQCPYHRAPAHEAPLISNICVHEIRPTANYPRMRAENTRLATYQDAWRQPPVQQRPRYPSQELRGGVLHVGCTCDRRDGLQDDCQRSDCRGHPLCVVHSGPHCAPSQAQKPTLDHHRYY
uniref:Uncharacterized protein n=1 Tax=Clastoptera arizonana TaxID=38151 RepID=A0A1B6DSW3_9HEMI